MRAKFLLPLVFIVIGCGNSQNNDESTTHQVAQLPKPADSPIKISVRQWFDEIKVAYNRDASNELVRATARNHLNEEWLFDQTVTTDTATYLSYQIGHDVSDDDGKRFVTDSWVYVDTLHRKLYEMNVAADKLSEWKEHSHRK